MPTDPTLQARIEEVREALRVGDALGMRAILRNLPALLTALEQRTELLEKADKHLWNRHACDFIRDGLIETPDDL